MEGLVLSLSVQLVYIACIFFSGLVHSYSVRSASSTNATNAVLQDIAIYTVGQRISPTTPFNLTFTLDSEEQTVKLALEPNHDLIIQEPHINFHAGGEVQRTEVIRREHHKIFRGTVFVQTARYQWEKAGWARISVVRDGLSPLFTGAFTISGRQYDIKLESVRPGYAAAETETRIVAYRDTQYDINTIHASTNPSWSSPDTLQKRQFILDASDFVDSIGDDSGCPSTRQIALVGIATDCSFTASFDSSEELIQSLVSMVNTASEVFESSFNIALSFHNLTVMESGCPSAPSDDEPWNAGCSAGDLNWRLNEFSSWRSQLRGDDNAYWTLMTGCPTGTEVGVSWVGELCNSDMGANVVASAANQWQVFAHESAHTFGAYHDCDSSTCSLSGSSRQCCPLSESSCNAGGDYLMNPISAASQTEFSPCTIGNVCSSIGSRRVSMRCLTTNTNTPAISAGECGNGIVEAGEECDCGDECDGNECCNGSTCRFRGDAVCDSSSGDGGCCRDCQFLSAGTVCRAAVGECDIEETCPGDSGDCPDDETEDDGSSCGDEGEELFCASGRCTSRDLQCQEQISGDNSTISSCENGADTCILSCSSPFATGSCSNAGTVLDGTPCDGGLCSGGVCQSSTRDNAGDVRSWVDRHRALVIGLSAGIGGFLVLVILVCLVCCCCRRRRPKSMSPVLMEPPLRPAAAAREMYMPPPAYSPWPVNGVEMAPTAYFRYA
ncbi:ADAM family of metalloprotease ADM-A [Aspergillus foveolatus]|uniref:ADAM family of metalloprotease ADM-A n=1 Tax=Aspergillus foveolatus TaxID=210207 RepID=UPI003CCE4786